MDDKLNAFIELLGAIPDDKVAEMADVSVAEVVAAREALEIPALDETGSTSESTEDQTPEPPAPEPKASKGRGGKSRPPTPKPKSRTGGAEIAELAAKFAAIAAPVVIKLLRKVRVTVPNSKGRPMKTDLIPNIYRGEMARRVIELVPEDERDAIELIS